MLHKNKLLKDILTNVGGTVSKTSSNNRYLRQIAENTGSQNIPKNKTDNYYLKTIAENTENNSQSLNEANATIAEQSNTISSLEGQVTTLQSQLTYAKNNSVALLSENEIIQNGSNCVLKAIVKKDGVKAVNENVYFYVKEEDE